MQKEKAKGSNSPLGGAPAFHLKTKQKKCTEESTTLIFFMQISTALSICRGILSFSVERNEIYILLMNEILAVERVGREE